jgi:hypothetical protein
LEIFEKLPEPSFVSGYCKIWKPDGTAIINKPKSLKFVDLVSHRSGFPLNPSSYFYHKSIHDIVGGYNEEEHYALDVEFIFRAVQVAHTKVEKEVWGNWRYLEETKTFQDNVKGLSRKRIDKIYTYYQKKLNLWQRFRYIVLPNSFLIRPWLIAKHIIKLFRHSTVID